jgi:hypothetical protein
MNLNCPNIITWQGLQDCRSLDFLIIVCFSPVVVCWLVPIRMWTRSRVGFEIITAVVMKSSACLVCWKSVDFSEEHTASGVAACLMLVSCLLLDPEDGRICSSETLTDFQRTTLRYILEERIPQGSMCSVTERSTALEGVLDVLYEEWKVVQLVGNRTCVLRIQVKFTKFVELSRGCIVTEVRWLSVGARWCIKFIYTQTHAREWFKVNQ